MICFLLHPNPSVLQLRSQECTCQHKTQLCCTAYAPKLVILLNLYLGPMALHACRSALTADDSPVLLGAGASLAAAFLERSMAAGDAVVLQRLMMLLTAPLSRLDSPGQVCIQIPLSSEGPLLQRVLVLCCRGSRPPFCRGPCGLHKHNRD